MNDRTRPTLLQRLRDGADALAWDEFYARYWRMIYAFARRGGCSDHTAEEIVQEVVLKVFQQRDVFHYDPRRGRFRDWLGTVVRNKVAEYHRRPSQRVRGRGDDSQALPREPETDDAPAETAWEAAFEQALLIALLDVVRRELNPRDYLAFELLTLRELPGADVARLTGMTRNAAYKTRKRVLRRLVELGQEYRNDGQLGDRLRQALRAQPAASVERSLTTRIEKTMRSR